MRGQAGHTRRRFFGLSSAAALTVSAQSARAGAVIPSEQIRVGVIGTGVRGKYLIGNLTGLAQVVAICDCATSRMAETLEPKGQFREILAAFRDTDAARCRTHQDYRRMIDAENVDAVIIATPDHHHVPAALLALEAGLDVYLEKPMTVSIREGRLLAEKVQQTGRVLQVGSQQRTMEFNCFACEFIRDGGLGEVTHVDCPNFPGPLSAPDFPAEPIPRGIDWNLFLGPAPFRSHNRKLWIKDEFYVGELLWRGWDLFSDYSGHLVTNWGAHSIDMVQYALGMDVSGPVKVTPAHDVSEATLEQDWLRKWWDKTPRPAGAWTAATRFLPVTLEYASGTTLRLTPGVDAIVFHGQRGRMTVSRNEFAADPAEIVKNGPDPKLAQRWEGAGHVARPHLENWLDCIRSRDVPHASVEVGHRTATVCHLVNLARQLNRPLHWDPAKELFVDDEPANELLDRPRREDFVRPGS